MFKSCCARPSKKLSKSKSKSEQINKMNESGVLEITEQVTDDTSEIIEKDNQLKVTKDSGLDECSFITDEESKTLDDKSPSSHDKLILEKPTNEIFAEYPSNKEVMKRDLCQKRFSVDYKRSRLDFKRFSVDCRRNSATLEELTRLEEELARTNVDVRPEPRRKSSGILKSTVHNSGDINEYKTSIKQDSCSDDDDVFEESTNKGDGAGSPKDPPATPVGRDELALRRHRFFSDLVCAARAAVEHRVRFDPLGPVVADSGNVWNFKLFFNDTKKISYLKM